MQAAYDDVQIARKVDVNDGLSGQTVALKDGFAAGAPVKYWDFGNGRRSAVPGYLLTHCDAAGAMAGPPIEHPILFDSIPGDGDYSPYRTINLVCVTPRYRDERITSVDALDDAIDLGLVLEPRPPLFWRNLPVVNRGIGLPVGDGTRPPALAYYKGKSVEYHDLSAQEGDFPNASVVPTGYVFEITRPGSQAVLKTIFSQPYRHADGLRNAAYSPQWLQVAVVLSETVDKALADAELMSWDEDADIVVYTGMVNTITMTSAPQKKPGTAVGTVTVSTNRVDRPFLVNEGAR